jgi:hypothetical protein
MISKKWIFTLVVTLLLLVTVATAGVAFAQENTESAAQPPALSILAPAVIGVDQPAAIIVTELGSGDPVEDAEVWALLQQPLVRPTAADVLSSNSPGWRYRFLGVTDDNGKVMPAPVFEKAGRFFIIATHNGYAPGLHFLGVQPSALAIRAPGEVTLYELITIKVTDKNSDEPVAEADIYDIYRNIPWNISPDSLIRPQRITDLSSKQKLEPAVQNGILSVNPVTAVSNVEASLYRLEEKTIHLGETDENGELTIAFDRPGLHRIMAKKEDDIPGTAQIKVVPDKPMNVLAIKGPSSADTGEEVTFTVVERHDGSLVAGADVYAIQLPAKWGNIKEAMPFELGSSLSADVQSGLEAMIGEYGQYLDTTDENGQITHVFTEEGRFLIVATADGYIPGVSYISIGDTMLQLREPQVAENVTPGLRFYQWRLTPKPRPRAGDNVTSGFDIKQFTPRLKLDVEEVKTRFRLDLKQFIPWLRSDAQGGS